MLKTDAITKRYGDVVAVSEVSIEVRRGEVLGIIGPNGAGKSTVVGMLSGALNADGGTVQYEGVDVTHVPAYKRARMGIGRTHQIPRPFRQMTVFENLLVARHYGGRSESDLGVHADCEAILHDLGLSSVAHTKAADLTLLQLKRLELARALALEPRILLMDEIGAGLVESEILELIEVIKALRHRVEAIVIIEHIMDVITECCDRVAVLDFGRLIADGPVQKVLAEPEVVSCYLGTGCEELVPRVTPHKVKEDASPILTLDHVSAGLRPLQGAHRHQLRRAPRRGRGPARHQRRRQDDRGARHQRHDPGDRRPHHLRGQGHHVARRARRGAARPRALHGGPAHLRRPHRAREPRAGRHVGRPQGRPAGASRPGLRPVRGAGRAAQQVGQAALRRPAAAAGHRPLADGRPRAHHLRRDRARARARRPSTVCTTPSSGSATRAPR